MDAKKKRELVVGGGVLVVLIGVILGAVYGGRILWGSRVGEKCEDDFSCQPHNICISHRCRRSCVADSGCESGWMCRPTSVSVTQGGDARNGYQLTSVKICFSPEAMKPLLARERQAQLAEKKRDVRRQTIVMLTTTPPQLTDAEFDTAWGRLPEEEQASSSLNALAQRIIALARAR